MLVSVGRAPNCDGPGAREHEGRAATRRGSSRSNKQQQTGDPNILAIGDVVGGVLLAHKASKEARIAVEAIMGEDKRVRETSSSRRWCSPIRRSPGAG